MIISKYYYLGIRLDDKIFQEEMPLSFRSKPSKVSRAEKFEIGVLMDC